MLTLMLCGTEFESFGGLLGTSWGYFGQHLAVIWGIFWGGLGWKRLCKEGGGVLFLPRHFWGRKVAPRLPQEAWQGTKMRPRGPQETTKRAFERKTSKPSQMTTYSIIMFDFLNLEGSENHKFRVRSGLESKRK